MLTIIINMKDFPLENKEIQEKLKSTYTAGGRTLPGVLSFFYESLSASKGDKIEIEKNEAFVSWEVVEISPLRLVHSTATSGAKQIVQQIFVIPVES